MKGLKKAAALFLSAILFLTAAPAASAGGGVRYLVTATRANLLPAPDLTQSPVGEIPHGTYVYAADVSGDFLYVRINATGLSGWIHASLVSYAGKDAANTGGVKSIYIRSKPAKTLYIEDEDAFDGDGLTVFAKFDDGRADAAVSGYRIFVPAFDSEGEKTVYVVYTPPGADVSFSASFSVTVRKVPLQELTVQTAPPASYIEHQPLSLKGMVVQATYSDGRSPRDFTAEEILSDPDFTLSGCHGETVGKPLSAGEHTFTLSYRYSDISCTFSVRVAQRKLINLNTATLPDRTTVYNKTEVPDLSGLTLYAVYDNGEEEYITPDLCEIACDPAGFVLGPGNKVTVSYGGKSVTLDFRYALETPTELRVITPEILAFVLGEPVDLTDLHVYVTYNSGRREETFDYTLSEIDIDRTGAQTVVVTCGEFSNTFTIYIQEYYRCGDVTGDGKITAYDARLVLRASVGFIRYKGKLLTAADADRNGVITAADARLVLRAAVGLETLS
ncbi:MAG: bacterial Ig-like domain-containing protein [Clostridia bacterium]|nr:bacterial Ig-like domain-containing protein [Clostridia bacterium]